MRANVKIVWGSGVSVDMLASPTRVKTGVLTDEHSSSSQGHPVVLIHGVPHGPADLGPDACVHLMQGSTFAEAQTLCEAARIAGYAAYVDGYVFIACDPDVT